MFVVLAPLPRSRCSIEPAPHRRPAPGPARPEAAPWTSGSSTLDQALIYVDLRPVAEPAARLRRPGVGGQRRVRRHRRLHHRLPHAEPAAGTSSPRPLLGIALAVHRRRARVAPGDEALGRVPDPAHAGGLVGASSGSSPPSPTLGGTYGLINLPKVELFGWTLRTPVDWVIPLARRRGASSGSCCWRIGESPYGRVLKGIREDEQATQSLGKNVFRSKVVVFGITSAHGRLRRRAADRLLAAGHARRCSASRSRSPIFAMVDLRRHGQPPRLGPRRRSCSARSSRS